MNVSKTTPRTLWSSDPAITASVRSALPSATLQHLTQSSPVEFNTTDKFDNTTTVCSQYLIGTDAPWKNIVRVNSGDTISLTGETNDDRFALVAKVVPRPLTQGNETLSPNSIKVDIIIKNYAYQCANSKCVLSALSSVVRAN